MWNDFLPTWQPGSKSNASTREQVSCRRAIAVGTCLAVYIPTRLGENVDGSRVSQTTMPIQLGASHDYISFQFILERPLEGPSPSQLPRPEGEPEAEIADKQGPASYNSPRDANEARSRRAEAGQRAQYICSGQDMPAAINVKRSQQWYRAVRIRLWVNVPQCTQDKSCTRSTLLICAVKKRAPIDMTNTLRPTYSSVGAFLGWLRVALAENVSTP